jgi:hypothetical protein
MKKIILIMLLLITWIPYLFLSTSVERPDIGGRAFNCTIKSAGNVSRTFGLIEVFYRPIRNKSFQDGGYKVFPQFFQKGEVFYAKCGQEEFTIGFSNSYKVDTKIHLYTETEVVKFFGYKLSQQESVNMYGTGWDGKQEGETILTKLVGHKEVKFLHGNPVK